MYKIYDEVVFDHLHEITYKDQVIGRIILGPIKNMKSIQRNNFVGYSIQNYKGDGIFLAGAGTVDYAKLV